MKIMMSKDKCVERKTVERMHNFLLVINCTSLTIALLACL